MLVMSVWSTGCRISAVAGVYGPANAARNNSQHMRPSHWHIETNRARDREMESSVKCFAFREKVSSLAVYFDVKPLSRSESCRQHGSEHEHCKAAVRLARPCVLNRFVNLIAGWKCPMRGLRQVEWLPSFSWLP